MTDATDATDAQDLARRYLALWEEYVTAALSDPAAAGPLWEWALGSPPPHDPAAAAEPAAGAATVAGASDECRGTVAQLTDRLALLEQRVAALEQGGEQGGEQRGEQGARPAARARKRNRDVRAC